MKVSEIITSVRRQIHDEADKTWHDPELLEYYNEVVTDLRMFQTQAQYDDNGNLIDGADAATTGDTSILADNWKPAAIHGICMYSLGARAGDKVKLELLAVHKAAYERWVPAK